MVEDLKVKDKMRTAIFPGTFNPYTRGHQSIVERGLKLFDRIVIAVGYNEHKAEASAGASAQAIVDEISALYADDDRVEVSLYKGLTVDLAREVGACCILRGVRSTIDFEYEKTLADVNRRLSGIETVLLYTLPELACVSGTMVRELAHNGVDVTEYLARRD